MIWHETNVLVIGAARQGIALSRYLAQKGAGVVLTDAQSADQLGAARQALEGLPVRWAPGGHPLSLLDKVDLVCPSGGVPLDIPIVQEARRRGIPLSNDSQIFMQAAPCIVVGITGSAGKTTTTTLVGRIAARAAEAGLFRRAYVGGNIGDPLIAYLDEMGATDLAVVEFSSFQLELMSVSPQVAALLNLSPNHLDRHGSMQAYTAAKRNIYAHQRPEDALVLGCEDPLVWQQAGEAISRVLAFGRQIPAGQPGAYLDGQAVWVRSQHGEQQVMPVTEIELRGAHNLLNVLAACAISAALGIPPEVMRAGIQGFGGVEHRLEFVRQWGGAQWYNDSKATSPEMTVTAMRAFSQPLVVLVGGRDKQLPWEGFAAQARAQARYVIAFGEAAPVVQRALQQAAQSEPDAFGLEVCAGLDQAVAAAARVVSPGDVVLLAPGGTSFDEFSDYEARGRQFKALVNSLPAKETST